MDFKKAFDTVNHDTLWKALQQQHVPQPYIQLLSQLYSDQTARVKTDKISRHFSIQRGVKQGDPLSSLLFNAVLEDMFRTLKHKWAQNSIGVRLGHTCLTQLNNLRFADDVLLLTTTKSQITQMLQDLCAAAAPYGLQIHPDKTKVLTNNHARRNNHNHITFDNHRIEILCASDNTKYLGRKLTFHNYHKCEIDNRIAAAWRKFGMLKHELTSKHYPLKSRLKLFDGAVTPTIMYGSASWTLTKDLEQSLQRTQRRMLRLIIGTPRRQVHTTTETITTITNRNHDHNHNDNSNDDDNDVDSTTSNTDLQQLINTTTEEETEP